MNAVDPNLGADIPGRAAPTPLRAASCGAVLLAMLLIAAWVVAPRVPALAAFRQTRLAPIGLAALSLCLAGLLGTLLVAHARRHAGQPAFAVRRWRPRPPAFLASPGHAGRWPQAFVVGGLAAVAAVLPWVAHASAPPAGHLRLGVAAVVLAFPLLVAERAFDAVPESRLPEAAGLRRLLLLAVGVWSVAGLGQVAFALGFPSVAAVLDTAVSAAVSAAAAELALRAFGRVFLPPPADRDARAAVDSLLLRMLADGVAARSVAGPVRTHLGIDFSRSWALAFLRRAAAPVACFLLLAAWGLSGVVILPVDGRAVYERLGVPASVLQPGLHAVLPWPMGRVRPVEYGVLHETTLDGAPGATTAAGAEDAPPPDVDRLWDGQHPSELTFLVASEAGGRQGFQIVSADIRVRYRIGLSDEAALCFAYRASDPLTLLRSVAGAVATRFFAGQTPGMVLGENREQLGNRLRSALQGELDRYGAGLDVLAVVLEAIHPPAGAAAAYHAVQAAQIMADASVSAERGRASATLSRAAQYAAETVDQARAAGAEAVASATGDTAGFGADQQSAAAHPQSFLLERRLTAIGAGLAKSTLTIIDRRIPVTAQATLDLRPLLPSTAGAAPRDGD